MRSKWSTKQVSCNGCVLHQCLFVQRGQPLADEPETEWREAT